MVEFQGAPMIPSVRSWRHRDGGFVLQLFGNLWMVEVCFARRRRDRHGLRKPFTVTTTIYEPEP